VGSLLLPFCGAGVAGVCEAPSLGDGASPAINADPHKVKIDAKTGSFIGLNL
jgi:hypothetical protein